MKTAKFGGTAMTAQNFGYVRQLCDDNCCIVVSAIGKEHPNDTKTTDLLHKYFLGDDEAWLQIESKYIRFAEVNGIVMDVEKLLCEAKNNACKSLAHCLSVGEELAAKMAAIGLGCDYIEAEQCLVFCGGKLHLKRSIANLKSAFKGVKRGVIGGFYGACESGRQVFSRGGSDVTGSVCAVATQSVLYENWTDVCGVCKANPKQIAQAATLTQLSYNQMYLLAQGGAEVLHPDAVKVAQGFGVPIKVGNYLRPHGDSTLVSNCPSQEKFLAVTERQASQGVVATLLHSMTPSELFARLGKVFGALDGSKHWDSALFDQAFERCFCGNNRVEICTPHSILRQLFDAFDS